MTHITQRTSRERRTAWSLRNEQSNCILIAPRSTDQLYLHLNALKVLAKLTPSIMDEVEAILSNKPVEKKRGQSIGERQAAIVAAAAATATAAAASGGGTTTVVTVESGASQAAAVAAATSSSGPVSV